MRKFFLLILSICLLTSCGADDQKAPIERMVKTVVIGGDDSSLARSYPGRVDAGQRVDMSFQVSGMLKEFPVKEGNKVAEGDLLAKLDNRDYQNRYDAAKAAFDTAEMNFKRGETLVKSGTIAQASFDELRSKYEAAKSNASIAQKALNDTSLYAPFGGLVARTFVDNFQEVQAKEKILSLQNVEDIDIIIDAPEKDLIRHEKVREGNQEGEVLPNSYIKFDALGDRRFEARIKKFATEADPTTQTYKITLTMQAPTDVNILPGMTANLVVMQTPGAQNEEAFMLPITAIATDANGKFYVWTVDSATMMVHKKAIEVGEMHGDSIQVKSGLTLGDRVVTAGVPYLEDGMKIRLFTNEY